MRDVLRGALLLCLLCVVPLAGTAVEKKADVPDAVVKLLKKNIHGLQISAVHRSPIDGLYEVVAGRNIFYSDKTGHYLIAGGHIFDTSNRKDLTAVRLQEINRVDWKSLPLDKAIVSGDPKGVPLAVFTDPDCPFCRKLEQTLQHLDGVKVYTFLFPLTQLHKHAEAHARAIWCASDRHEALLDIMLRNKKVAEGKCAAPIDELRSLGIRLGVSGTPTLIAGDGRIFAGLKSAEELKRWLAHP